ncbi:unnamed protein product [Discosporangium mesarthrocarpum]
MEEIPSVGSLMVSTTSVRFLRATNYRLDAFIWEVLRGIARVSGTQGLGMSLARRPLMIEMGKRGKHTLSGLGEKGQVIWRGLYLSFFFLCKASDLVVEADGVTSRACLVRNCLSDDERTSWLVREGDSGWSGIACCGVKG